jgi:hypothetical protein
MKAGVITFSYAEFHHFQESIEQFGYYTSNLGDNAQTIASRRAWRSVGVEEENIISIDRDTMKVYSGEPVALIMNAVFGAHMLPPSAPILPIFLGFCADAETISSHSDWLRDHAPIGCRDVTTADICRANGIEAFVTGCVTLTLPPRTEFPDHGKLFIVLGWPHLLPLSLLSHIPADLFENCEIITHRHVEGNIPLNIEQQKLNESYEKHLLQRYREEAKLVLTPLLHVSSPCVAMQIPTIICRSSFDSRFSLMNEIMPVYTPEIFGSIDWKPPLVAISKYRDLYIEKLRSHVDNIY